MMIEMHIIQNHAPSNLNRDDSGSPKDCIFGGVRRARISSQCIKRSIRRSPLFLEDMTGIEMAVRTRRLPEKVKEILIAKDIPEDMAAIAATKASGFGNREGREQSDGKTAQMMFLTQHDIAVVAELLYAKASAAASVEELKRINAKDLQNEAFLRGWRPITPDIALFGRMITSEAFKDVEASVQVAHAISTHRMEHEFDYYTAVDDFKEEKGDEDETGAGMIGDVEFNSACYYKYFSLDFEALLDNLAGPPPDPSAGKAAQDAYVAGLEETKKVAARTVMAFLKAAVFTTPTGKQNSFAAHQLPDGILVEVRPLPTPVSYANAFVKPAQAHGQVDLVEESLRKLAEHVELLTRKFSLQADPRLWFCTREVTIAGTIPCETFDELLHALSKVVAG